MHEEFFQEVSVFLNIDPHKLSNPAYILNLSCLETILSLTNEEIQGGFKKIVLNPVDMIHHCWIGSSNKVPNGQTETNGNQSDQDLTINNSIQYWNWFLESKIRRIKELTKRNHLMEIHQKDKTHVCLRQKKRKSLSDIFLVSPWKPSLQIDTLIMYVTSPFKEYIDIFHRQDCLFQLYPTLTLQY